jgi:broad specificity phosphatase PhoE
VLRVLVVQHGEKESLPGDPGLTEQGRAQAQVVADWLGDHETPTAIWSSPLRRATETAAPIAARFGLDVVGDVRLRERINWDEALGSLDAFLEEWQRSTADRSYQPPGGDSSEMAATRFLAALADIEQGHADGLVVVVTHGGVTVDVLRTLLGDDAVLERAPILLEAGVPSGAVTRLRRDAAGWAVDSLPGTTHLRT